jgi:hypothetical protein
MSAEQDDLSPLLDGETRSEREANLAKLSAAVPLVPFLAAQGYQRAERILEDGTVFFVRSNECIAVALPPGGVPLCTPLEDKEWSNAVGRPYISPSTRSFDELGGVKSGGARPLHQFIAESAGLQGRHVELELAAWTAWSQDPGLRPLRGIQQRKALGGLTAAAEFESLLRERQFASRPVANGLNLDSVGISSSTLDAQPFKGVLRSDGAALVAVNTDQHGIASIARTTLAGPGRSDVVDGGEQGVWVSAASSRAVSKIIITQSPLTAMAHYQQHRDDSVRYIAVGGDSLADGQNAALRARIEEIAPAQDRAGKPLEIAVTSHHRAHGLKLYGQVETLLREDPRLQITGLLPDNTLGRDWIELARTTRQPELRVDLPAYAASRLGFQEIYCSPESTKVLMAVDAQPARAKLLFSRQSDGSWRYENDIDHPSDKGTAIDFARSRLQLSLQDFRHDLQRFDKEQQLRRAPALRPDNPELNRQGILPETIDNPLFRGAVRRDGDALVYAHHNLHAGVRGVEVINRIRPKDQALLTHQVAAETGLWFSNPPARVDKVVVVQTPVVAMAYHQQHPAENVQYVATTAESLSRQQGHQLASYVRSLNGRGGAGVDVVVATERGRHGVEQARVVELLVRPHPGRAITVRKHAPTTGRDWIESAAKHERAFIRQLPKDKSQSLGQGL